MKKPVPAALNLVVVFALSLSLFFACSTESDDDEKKSDTTYAIVVNPVDARSGESVTPHVTKAKKGATITLTASLGTERRVALSADGVSITPATISANGDTATFTMPASAVMVTATFSDIPPTLYPITITPSGATGSEAVTANVTEAKEGTTITLTASLGTGRHVALSADGIIITPATISANGVTATFTMPGKAVAVTATFYTVYSITITPTGAAGSEAVTANVSEAKEGAIVTLTASLGAGCQVALSAPGVSITPSTISTNNGTATFTMPGNGVAVTVAFSYSAGAAVSKTVNTKAFNIHYVPSGTFIMGENVQSPVQTVTLTKNFWMGETEVTQGLWEAVWGTTLPGSYPESEYGAGANYPAYHIDWYHAVAFCNVLTVEDPSIADTERVYYSDAGCNTAYTKANAANKDWVYVAFTKKGYRLPTEAEWEYAARYIEGTNWNHGNHASGDTEYACYAAASCTHTLATKTRISGYAWYRENNGTSGTPEYGNKEVRQTIPNTLGLRDMSGNVEEWCYDWLEPYSGATEIDPTGPESGSIRISRGGNWYDEAEKLRCARRGNSSPNSATFYNGFRLCRTAD